MEKERERERERIIALSISFTFPRLCRQIKFVIHTVPPDWKDDSLGPPDTTLETCYHNSLEV